MKLGQKMLGKKLFGEIMKRTFYGQFVAGPVFSYANFAFQMSILVLDWEEEKIWHMSKLGHCGDHTNDRADAQLWGEEHPGLQRGGGHQPGGGRAERDGVSFFFFRLLLILNTFPVPVSPEWIRSEQSLRSQVWARTSSLQVNSLLLILFTPNAVCFQERSMLARLQRTYIGST